MGIQPNSRRELRLVASLIAAGTAIALAAPADAATGPPAAPVTHEINGTVQSLSCGSASTCFAIIRHSNGRSYIGRLVDGGASSHLAKISKTEGLGAISCPTHAGCETVGTDEKDSRQIFVPVSASGKPGKAQTVKKNGLSISAIGCHANREHCLAAGSDNSGLGLVTLTGSKLGVHRKSIPKGESDGYSIDCPTASYCEVVGVLLPDNGHNAGFAIAMRHGKPGKLVKVPRANNNGLVGLGCENSKTCYTVASTFSGAESLVTLTAGKVTHSTALPTDTNAKSVSCTSAHTCFIVGQYASATADHGEIIPIHNGKLGTPQTTSVTSEYQLSSAHGRLVASGYGSATKTVVSS